MMQSSTVLKQTVDKVWTNSLACNDCKKWLYRKCGSETMVHKKARMLLSERACDQ